MYAKQNIYSRRRYDIERPNIECVWIEVSVHNKKILIGTFYRPPNSAQELLSSIEDSISLAHIELFYGLSGLPVRLSSLGYRHHGRLPEYRC